jgi:uncharacterized protein YndB with AHSA1/START domain
LAVVASGARGEVVDAAPGGFTIENEVFIAADRATVWKAAIEEVGQWWNDDHTVSGSAGRMSITPVPQGCFCESFGGDDGIVHLVVTSVSTPVMLRMTGGLGPLGVMGVDGNMLWEFFDDGAGTRVRFTYAVGGYSAEGLDTIAEPVDFVIGEALGLLKAHVERD